MQPLTTKNKGGDFLDSQDGINRAKVRISNFLEKIGLMKFKIKGFSLIGLAPVIVLGFLLTSLLYVQLTKPTQLFIDGTPTVLVSSEKETLEVLEDIKLDLASRYPEDSNLHYDAKLTFNKNSVKAKAKAVSTQEVKEVLLKQVNWQLDGTIIEINNVKTAVLSCSQEAEKVLEAVKQAYLPKDGEVNVLNAEFVEPVKIIKDTVDIDELDSTEEAVLVLTQGKEKVEEYELKEGDSLWTIARANNTTVEELKAANPQLGKILKIGQVMKLTKAEPCVSVKMIVEAVKEEDIPYDTVYEKDKNSYKGQQTTLKKGKEGKKAVTYQIAQVNGVELERKVLAETVISEPVDRIVKSGTKTIVASRGGGGSGVLAWPLRGRINSPYGPRSRGYHTGIDIDANKGDPIYSAAAGTVTKSAYSGGYGNCIILDHGDGLSTLYAHLSQRNVSVGQKVGKNELIGLAGSTGNSTGAHLHFEVRINGKTSNPINYLN